MHAALRQQTILTGKRIIGFTYLSSVTSQSTTNSYIVSNNIFFFTTQAFPFIFHLNSTNISSDTVANNTMKGIGLSSTSTKITTNINMISRTKQLMTAAVLSSLATGGPLHARAFSVTHNNRDYVNFGKKSQFVSKNRVRNLNFCISSSRCFASSSLQLSPSAVIDEASSSALEEEDVNSKKNLASSNDVIVAARGDGLYFLPSPDRINGGIMAVKLYEEDYVPNDNAKEGGSTVPATISGTGMFGGVTSAAGAAKNKVNKSQQKSSQGDDFTGKSVLFSDGGQGVVIAQRPPIAFVLCDFSSPKTAINKDNEPKGDVSILSKRSSIAVSDSFLGSVVDCNGKPIHMNDDGSISIINANKIAADDKTCSSFLDRAIFAPIPQVKDIALINTPLISGTTMVDTLAPIGKGQNMLVIGTEDGKTAHNLEGVGQRDLMIRAIQAQVREQKKGHGSRTGSKCIYALTTSDKNVRKEVMKKLEDAGVLDDIVVVFVRQSLDDDHRTDLNDQTAATAAEAVAVAATACSIGEAFALAKGDDAFVVVDNIDQHKTFWDWTTRVLVDVYGIDAVVKDDIEGGASSEMRAFFSGLVQRAAQFNKKNGGGSISLVMLSNLPESSKCDEDEEESVVFSPDDFEGSTDKVKQRISILAQKNIPLTAATLKKIQIPIPVASETEKRRLLALQHVDDLISMSDGQIWLDETLHHEAGQRPALDPQRSITRVGIGADTESRADAPAIRGLGGGLRFEFAQAASLEGADVSPNSGAEKQILKRDAYLLAMHQGSNDVVTRTARTLSESCVALLAASTGSLNKIVKGGATAGTERGQIFIDGLFDYVWKSAPDAMKDIDDTLDLSSSVRSEIEEAIKTYCSSHVGS